MRSALCWWAGSVAEPLANMPQNFLGVNHNTLHRATIKVEAWTVENARKNPSSVSTIAITSDSGNYEAVRVFRWSIGALYDHFYGIHWKLVVMGDLHFTQRKSMANTNLGFRIQMKNRHATGLSRKDMQGIYNPYLPHLTRRQAICLLQCVHWHYAYFR
jgi:hypothetical protein